MINIGGGDPAALTWRCLKTPGKFYILPSRKTKKKAHLNPCTPFLDLKEMKALLRDVAEAPHSVLFGADGDDPKRYKGLLDILAIGLANPATNNAILPLVCVITS